MIEELDQVLKSILDDTNTPWELQCAEVSFEIPNKDFNPARKTVNLYLYDVHENRELRDPVPIKEWDGSRYIRRRPPLRFDCSYMITAWSKKEGEEQLAEEHKLLGQALYWLSRFPIIPENYWPSSWKQKVSSSFQPFPILMWVAQMDGVKEPGEFWAALENPPKPYINLMVTIAMDLQTHFEVGPPVITKEIHVMIDNIIESDENWFEIGGTVKDAASSQAIEKAHVTLVEMNKGTLTNVRGQFTFSMLNAGNYTIRVKADGYDEHEQSIVIPGSAAAAYDVKIVKT